MRPDRTFRARFLTGSFFGQLVELLVGLTLFGLGVRIMANAGVGLGPWEVFHQGISRRTGLELGTVSIALGLPILALWIPLRQMPGLGTVLNVLMIGSVTNLTKTIVPLQTELLPGLVQCVIGVVTIGVGSGLYLGADLGPGPRDGLMTGLHRRFGWSIRVARTTVEVTVLALGFLMGGTVGFGTLAFAFGIGPVVQWALGFFDRGRRVARREEVRELDEAPGTVGE